MKRLVLSILVLLVSAGIFITGCSEQKPAKEKAKVENLSTTPADIKKEAKDLADTTSNYFEEQKQLYIQKVLNMMSPANQKMMQLNNKMASINAQARAEMTAELDNFYKKMQTVSEKVHELQTASSETYSDLKKGVENSVEEMDRAYDKLMSRFQK